MPVRTAVSTTSIHVKDNNETKCSERCIFLHQGGSCRKYRKYLSRGKDCCYERTDECIKEFGAKKEHADKMFDKRMEIVKSKIKRHCDQLEYTKKKISEHNEELEKLKKEKEEFGKE